MLVGQAAHALRLWLDLEPPVREMQAAALTELARREQSSP
jgi:shikimate 5-dehydrogenase